MVSVALTTYNGEKYIIQQLKSILNQSVRVDEIIISDDHSTDNTVRMIQQYIKDSNESRIKLNINETNIGYTENFYKAISRTNGEYIFLSDQDDIWKFNKVERMLEVIKKEKCEVLCSNYEIIDSEGGISDKTYNIPEYIKKAPTGVSKISIKRLMLGNIAQGCTFCFTAKIRDIYISIHYKEIIHDHQLIVIGAAMKGAYFINEKLIDYRIHNSNAIGFSDGKKIRNIDFIIRHKEPRMVTFLKKVKRFNSVDCYKCCVLMLYFRIPIIYAIVSNRFRKN